MAEAEALEPVKDKPEVSVNDEVDLEKKRVELCKEIRDCIERGEAEEALQFARKGLTYFHKSGYLKGEASALLMKALASANLRQVDPTETLSLAQKALIVVQKSKDLVSELELMRLIAHAHVEERDFGMAVSTATALVEKSKELESPVEMATARFCLAEVRLAAGSHDEAYEAAKQALASYMSLGDKCGEGRCHIVMSDIHLFRGDVDDAMDAAAKANSLFHAEGDLRGRANACHRESLVHKTNGDYVEALRSAEKAFRLWWDAGDFKSAVDAQVSQVSARLTIIEDRGAQGPVRPEIVTDAAAAVKQAKKMRKHDLVCMGNALYTHARVLERTNDAKGMLLSATQAVRCFYKAGKEKQKALATLLWASAARKMCLWKMARENLNEALSYFERVGDEAGVTKALQAEEQLDRAMGRPTRAMIAAEQERRLMEQQQFMLQQQAQWQAFQQAQGGQMAQQQYTPVQEHVMPDAARSLAKAGFTRDGASPLDVSSGVDGAVIRAKILDLTGQIIGETDDIEIDTPLMEAGLTSNSAVLLRDELSKDLPGVSLPATLIFDYPSIGAISDFVVEKASKK